MKPPHLTWQERFLNPCRDRTKMVDRSFLFDIPVPNDVAMRTKFDSIAKEYLEGDHVKAIDIVVDKIETLIGKAFGLDTTNIALICTDMTDYPFLEDMLPHWLANKNCIHDLQIGLDRLYR